jgi:CO/xanthine dehydrogenase FAD-binding subunit
VQAVSYQRASTVSEAIDLLRDGGETTRVLAGGTDLIVQARERKRNVDRFIDIKHIPEVMGVSYNASSGLTVGAAAPLYQVYADNDVKTRYPALVEAATVIGGTAIQGRASLGGNLCNSSPAGDALTAMMVLGAVAHIAGPNGERNVPVTEFFTGPGANVLQLGEFVVNIQIPAPEAGSGGAWQRFIPRNEMDIAVVNCGTYVVLAGDTVTDARIALGAVAATPIMAPTAAEAIIGNSLTDETIAAAAAAASETARPIEDMRGSIRQRKHLVGVLTERTLRIAAERARA